MSYYVDEDAIAPLWKGLRFPLATLQANSSRNVANQLMHLPDGGSCAPAATQYVLSLVANLADDALLRVGVHRMAGDMTASKLFSSTARLIRLVVLAGQKPKRWTASGKLRWLWMPFAAARDRLSRAAAAPFVKMFEGDYQRAVSAHEKADVWLKAVFASQETGEATKALQ